MEKNLDSISALCKRAGFIFPSSEIYGGLNGFWDYGPMGSELKRNIRDAWWHYTVQWREDVVGLDATIIMNPRIWEASGHVGGFADPMVDCKDCKKRHRADQLCEEQGLKLVQEGKAWKLPEGCKCTACGSKNLTEPRSFNLMFKTYVGPVEDDSAVAYLRPETAQAIFAQFLNIVPTSRKKVPFGVAQSGKSFRNEINPRNYTFRSREFEQMELEFFIRPDEAVELICGHVATLADKPDLGGEPQEDWGWEVWAGRSGTSTGSSAASSGTASRACPSPTCTSTGRPRRSSRTTPAPASTSSTRSRSASRSSRASPRAPTSTSRSTRSSPASR